MKIKLLSLYILALLLLGSTTISKAQFSKFFDFSGVISGTKPYGNLISDGTYLYGTTSDGGTSSRGTIFKILPDGSGYVKLHDFIGLDGEKPIGTLLLNGTSLFGVTNNGGNGIVGVIFKIQTDGTGFTVLLDLDMTSERHPIKSLIFDGTYLYGTVYSVGQIFKIKPDGTNYTLFGNFGGSNGDHPFPLIFDGTYLYGMTNLGGLNGDGVIFKIKPDGTGQTKLFDFNNAISGQEPEGALLFDGTYLYGMTTLGGSSNLGTIFKIKPDGSSFLKLVDFTGLNGSQPSGELIYDGTFLYGMTKSGGVNNKGVVFKMKTDGTSYSTMLDFDGPLFGSEPWSSLFSDGSSLYGMTTLGGINDEGAIFKYSLPTGIAENSILEQMVIFPNIGNGIFTITTTETNESTMEIIDITGKKIYESTILNKKEIDISEKAEGVYFVRLTKDGQILGSKKLFIVN